MIRTKEKNILRTKCSILGGRNNMGNFDKTFITANYTKRSVFSTLHFCLKLFISIVSSRFLGFTVACLGAIDIMFWGQGYSFYLEWVTTKFANKLSKVWFGVCSQLKCLSFVEALTRTKFSFMFSMFKCFKCFSTSSTSFFNSSSFHNVSIAYFDKKAIACPLTH